MTYRKKLHDQFITDFTAIKHDGSSDAVFAAVKKHFFDIPENTPACRIIPMSGAIQSQGNSTDIRTFSFQADVYELIEAAATEAEALRKIDRLANIEDAIIAYLEKIPNNVESKIAGMHVVNINIPNIFYSYELAEAGTVIFLTVIFEAEVLIVPQNL